MPKIPVFTRTATTPRGLTSPGGGIAAAAAPFAALSSAADTLSAVAIDALARRKQAEDDSFVSTEFASFVEQQTKRNIEAERTAPLGAEEHSKRTMEDFDTFAGPLLDVSPSDEARARLEAKLNIFRARTFDDANLFEDASQQAKRQTDLVGTLDSLGSSVFLDPDLLVDNLNALKEAVADAEGYLNANAREAILTKGSQAIARNAVLGGIELNAADFHKRLTSGEFNDVLSSNDLITLTQAARSRKETLENKALAGQDKRLREAEAASLKDVNAIVKVVEAYGIVPPDFPKKFLAAGQFPEQVAALQDARRGAQEVHDLLRLPVPAQAEALKVLRDKTDFDLQDLATLQRLTKAHAGFVKLLATNPIEAARLAGHIDEATVLDYGEPESLSARAVQVAGLEQQYGVRLRMLSEGEVAGLEKVLDDVPPEGAVAILSVLNEAFGLDRVGEIATSMAVDKPAFAQATYLSTDNPDTSRLVLQGLKILKDPQNKDLKPTPVEFAEAVTAAYGSAFLRRASARGPIKAAATAIFAASVVGGFAEVDRETQLDNALLKAGGAFLLDGDLVGGPVEYNDRFIILPPHVTEDEFVKNVEKIDEIDMAVISTNLGAPVDSEGRPFSAEDIIDGKWEQIDVALFRIIPDGKEMPAFSANGGDYIIDYSKLRDAVSQRNIFLGATVELPSQ